MIERDTVNKKRRKVIILKNYDYSQTGYYFVTICTKERNLYFENEKITQIARKFWLEIPQHFESVKLDRWIIMPNHLNGIISRNTPIIKNVVGSRHACSLQNKAHQKLPVIIGSLKSAVSREIVKILGYWNSNGKNLIMSILCRTRNRWTKPENIS